MIEHYLHIASHRERFSLLVSQEHVHGAVPLKELLLCAIGEDLCDVETLAIINFKEWSATAGRHIRYLVELDGFQSTGCWWLYLFFVIALEIVQVTELTRLRDALAAYGPSVTVKLERVVDVVKEAHVKKYGANRCTRAAFSRVAVNNDHSLRIL